MEEGHEDRERPQWGMDEMNVAEFPIAVLSERAPRAVRTLERWDTGWDPAREVYLPRKVLITGADRWGLPCAGDNDTHLALVSLTKKANSFSARRVQFSRGEVARELGWSPNGRTYRRIKLALHRLAGVRIVWENSWFDNREKRHRTRDSGVLDDFELYERYAAGKLVDCDDRPSTFIWSEFMFESFQANYVKPINMEVYRRLELPIARQSFRLLDKRFHFKRACRFRLREFAEKIGLTRYRYESKIKDVLAPSLAALETQGVIREGRRYEPAEKRGRYWINFHQGDYERRKGKSFVAVPRVSHVRREPRDVERETEDGEPNGCAAVEEREFDRLLAELTRRRVSRIRAESLLRTKQKDTVDWVRLVEWAIEDNDTRVAAGKVSTEKAPGRLANTIDMADAPPEGFVSAAERAANEKQKTERAQTKTRMLEERKRLRDRESAQEDQIVSHYLTSLPDTTRAQLVEEAWAEATREERNFRGKNTPAGALIEEHVLKRYVLGHMDAGLVETAAA